MDLHTIQPNIVPEMPEQTFLGKLPEPITPIKLENNLATTKLKISDSELNLIPLKTFFAQTGPNARNFGRQNVICYFTPTPSNETEGLYSFANSTHQWLLRLLGLLHLSILIVLRRNVALHWDFYGDCFSSSILVRH